MRITSFPARLTAIPYLGGALLFSALCAPPAAAQYDTPPSLSSTPADTYPSSRNPYVTFFPPTAPIYGASIPDGPTVTGEISGRSLNASEDLADYVGEIFYPALGSRIFAGTLTNKLDRRLDAYRAKRGALLDELAIALAVSETATPQQRESSLRTLAAKQAGALDELEKEADNLRRDIIKGGILSETVDWNVCRIWRLNDPDVVKSPLKLEAEFQVARAAAFFQDGLSIEQRGLLRELAMEQSRAAGAARGRPASRSGDNDPQAMFFAPETARFKLPQPLPLEIVTLIARFNAEKGALKRELLDALRQYDQFSDKKRAARFTDFAGQQSARISALDTLAEEIRRALATLPSASPTLPPIPPELRERIDLYTRDQQTFAAEMRATQRRVMESIKMDWTAFFRMNSDQRERTRREHTDRINAALQAAAKDFADKNADRVADLSARHTKIREDLALVASGLTDTRTGKPVTAVQLIEAYRVANQRFDTIGREEAMYERYRYAMLQPGLSPSQRRLLFRAGHASIAQSLPRAEYTTSQQTRPRITF